MNKEIDQVTFEQKNKPATHTKNITYENLCMQEYLLDDNKTTELARLIYKARKNTKWKYSENICVGCSVRSETDNELLSCPVFSVEVEE